MKQRKKKTVKQSTVPVTYPHKVEAWLQAVACSVRGTQLVADALLAQQKTDCNEQAPTIAAAEESFDKAKWWVNASKKAASDCERRL